MFDNDMLSRDNLLKDLDINALGQFNSMNVQCMLPRIDQNLIHNPILMDQTKSMHQSFMSGMSGT
jgi:hypothetical protein